MMRAWKWPVPPVTHCSFTPIPTAPASWSLPCVRAGYRLDQPQSPILDSSVRWVAQTRARSRHYQPQPAGTRPCVGRRQGATMPAAEGLEEEQLQKPLLPGKLNQGIRCARSRRACSRCWWRHNLLAAVHMLEGPPGLRVRPAQHNGRQRPQVNYLQTNTLHPAAPVGPTGSAGQ